MKVRKMLLTAQVVSLALILLGGCAKPNKDLFYGTFTNENESPPKTVHAPGVMKDYAAVSDTTPIVEGTEQIFDYWTDSEGNVWFKTNAIWKGAKFQTLQKISKSGTVLEIVSNGVTKFDSKSFPTKVDPTGGDYYRIYHRAEK
jgi:hypothetical protein